MQNLLEQMAPEVKELLLENAKTYPNTFQSIMDELECTSFISDLKVSTADTLITYFDMANLGSPEPNTFMRRLYEGVFKYKIND